VCLRSGIEFDKKDLIKLVQTYGLQSSSVIMEKSLDRASLGDLEVDYKKISTTLGLHKESFNYFTQVHLKDRAQNLNKLRQFYQTIDGHQNDMKLSGGGGNLDVQRILAANLKTTNSRR